MVRRSFAQRGLPARGGAVHALMVGRLITIVAASLLATRIRVAAKASAFANASADKSMGEPTESAR